MADRTSAFVFYRSSAFWAGADKHCLSVSVAPVAVPAGFVALLRVFLERLCDRIGTGGYLAPA